MMNQSEAEYKPAHSLKACAFCAMFRLPHSCTLVEGTIRASYVCKFWSLWKGAVNPGEVK